MQRVKCIIQVENCSTDAYLIDFESTKDSKNEEP